MKFLKILAPFILVIIFAYFAFKPLLIQGFYPMHDNTQVARTYEMTKALGDGMFPVRWVQDLGYGYGYPLFNYYDPLAFYVSGIIGLTTNALAATKTMIIIAIILSGISMYVLGKEFWGIKGGLVSSVFYMFAPYHAVDIFVRGDIAESFAYALIPFLFYGLWILFKRKSKLGGVLVSALSFAGIITAHNLTALMVAPFAVLFAVLLLLFDRKNLKRNAMYAAASFILGAGLSAFYSAPAILEMKYSNVLSQVGGGANFRDHFVCLYQFWTSPWGYGGSTKGCIDGLSFMIGKYHILLSLAVIAVGMFLVFAKKKIDKEQKSKIYVIFAAGAGALLSVFLATQASQPIWEATRVMAFLQYPWRFLVLISFFASFITGAAVWYLEKHPGNKNLNLVLSAAIIIFVIIVSVKFFVPQKVLNVNASDYTNAFALEWTASNTSHEYMPASFQRPKSYYDIPDIKNLTSKDLSVNIVKHKTGYMLVDLKVNSPGTYILPVAYFPAWQAKLDGKTVKLSENERGMEIFLPKGVHNLSLNFSQTPIELASDFITIASILILILGIIYLRQKNE